MHNTKTTTSRPPRGQSIQLTKQQRRDVMRSLKTAALAGDVQASIALSNFELAEVTRRRVPLDLDRVAA